MLYGEVWEISVSDNASTTEGLTRRELLKRGAALGGALAWATPAVQLVGMSRAMASHVSDLCICVKLEGCSNESGEWVELGSNNPGNCLDSADTSGCDSDYPAGEDPEFAVGQCTGANANAEFCIEFNEEDGTATIHFPERCSLIALAEKVGGGTDPSTCNFIVDPANNNPVTQSPFTFDVTINQDPECSHLEFCFAC